MTFLIFKGLSLQMNRLYLEDQVVVLEVAAVGHWSRRGCCCCSGSLKTNQHSIVLPNLAVGPVLPVVVVAAVVVDADVVVVSECGCNGVDYCAVDGVCLFVRAVGFDRSVVEFQYEVVVVVETEEVSVK